PAKATGEADRLNSDRRPAEAPEADRLPAAGQRDADRSRSRRATEAYGQSEGEVRGDPSAADAGVRRPRRAGGSRGTGRPSAEPQPASKVRPAAEADERKACRGADG